MQLGITQCDFPTFKKGPDILIRTLAILARANKYWMIPFFPDVLRGHKLHKVFNAMPLFLPCFVLHRKQTSAWTSAFNSYRFTLSNLANPTSSLVWCVFIRPIFLLDCVLRTRCLSREYLFHVVLNEATKREESHKLV